jgi:hypothetical protein
VHGWARPVAHMEELRNAYNFFLSKSLMEDNTWEFHAQMGDNIKLDVEEIWCMGCGLPSVGSERTVFRGVSLDTCAFFRIKRKILFSLIK